MNTLKNAALLIVMGGVLYFVYLALNKPHQASPFAPVQHQHASLAPPQIETGAPGAVPPASATTLPAPFSAPPIMTPAVAPTNTAPALPPPEAPTIAGIPGPVVDIPGSNSPLPAPEATMLPPPGSANPLRSDFAAAPVMPSQPALPPNPATTTPNAERRSVYESPTENASNPAAPTVAPVALIGTPVERGRSLTAFSLQRDFQRAEAAVNENRFVEALTLLSPYHHAQDISSTDRDTLLRWLDALAGKVIYSPEHTLAAAYHVSKHETLLTIAETHQVPWELLQNINRIRDPQVLVSGTSLKIIPGPFRAEVDLGRSEMTLFVRDLYAGRFPFTQGDEPPQPGEYRIRDKSRERSYYLRDGRVIAANDPNNPYGGYWLDLGASNACLHGSCLSGNPRTNGLGSISFSPQDAQDIFGILSKGSQVVVKK